ncbi:restriction endonuclease subunit S [Vibrio coralliilyticus]|uniref:restriction endonuclease subunit S n=1 Tax=Vibrio coralliilyticus TaxID=190893 RepID=UPI0024094AC6|nr:restriction endonuclease subunit S [Vibrio coralliilyticus]WFB49020.1 restriction endonuclease subunit S [Vibrio coralliilyticus]
MTGKKSIQVEGSYAHTLQIPHSWEFAKFSDVIEIIGGSQPPKSEFLEQPEGDCVRLIQIRDYKSDNNVVYIPRDKAKRFVAKDEVMIGRYGPPIFQILRGLEGTYNVALMKARPRDGIFSNDYLYRYLSNKDIYNYVDSASDRTAGQSGVNKKHLEQYPVAVPPLPEQKRIVEKLDEVLAQVDTIKMRLDGIPDLLKRFRQSVLASAVSGKLTEEWRVGRCIEPAAELLKNIAIEREKTYLSEIEAGNKDTKRLLTKVKKHNPTLPEDTLPTGWEWTSFMASMQKVVDCHNKTAPYIDEGIPLIRTPDIRNGKISLTGAMYISEETYDYWSRRCPPKSGDIIFTREAPMGEAGIVPDGVKLCMGQRMMLLRPMPNYVEPKYALLNILSLSFQERMESQAIGTGVKHLRVADVESLSYPLAPLEEQKEIVRLVDQYFALADTIEAQVKKAQARVDNLTQSILAKAFRGELVPQDPNDEPADKLLERIAKARTEAEALAKAAKKAQAAKKRAAKA